MWPKSSHRRCSIKEAVYKNFAIFTGKHLCWSLCLTCDFFKKIPHHRWILQNFPVNISKFSRTPMFVRMAYINALFLQVSIAALWTTIIFIFINHFYQKETPTGVFLFLLRSFSEHRFWRNFVNCWFREVCDTSNWYWLVTKEFW